MLVAAAPTAGAALWGPGSGGYTHPAQQRCTREAERAKWPVEVTVSLFDPLDLFTSLKTSVLSGLLGFDTSLIAHLQSCCFFLLTSYWKRFIFPTPLTHKECT